MKNYNAALLLHLSLHTLTAAQAQVPIFNQRAPEEYIGDVTNDGGTGPEDIKILDADGLDITFGSEFSKRIMDVAKAHCENPEDEECKKQMQQVLGVGPTNNGIQKRIVGLVVGGVVAAYLVFKLLSYVWHRLGESDKLKVIHIKISEQEKQETSKWEQSDAFQYKPFEGDLVTVPIDNSQPMVEKPPSIVKEANGDITVTLPGIVSTIEESWKSIICERNTKRSLYKRATMQCIIQRAQAFMRHIQQGGQANPVRNISPLDFPKPKNNLIVGALEQDKNYAENLWFGGGLAAGARGDIATFATWIAAGYEIGNLRFEGDKMKFPSSFLDLQDDIPKGECPEGDLKMFCSNCGGNADNSGGIKQNLGKCVGLGDGEKKGLQNCECFVDETADDFGYSFEEAQLIFNYLHNLPDKKPDDKPKGPQLKRKQCYKLDEERMKDHHNWKFVQQQKLDDAIKTHCDKWSGGTGSDGVSNIKSSSSYNNGDGDWDYVLLEIFQPKSGMATKEQCQQWMSDISAGCDWDGAELEKNINQFNWKWGGEVELDNGVKFSIKPYLERVHFDRKDLPLDRWVDDPPENHNCYSLGKFSDHDGNKGLNGVALDDKAKMTLQQCVHQLRNMDEDTDVSCGGLMKMGFHRKSYTDIKSCAENTWRCVSYFVENGESARGEHKPWFSDCWADLMF